MLANNLKVYVVRNPFPHHGGRYFIFLKLFTDNGIEGVGEVYCATFHPCVIKKMIEDGSMRLQWQFYWAQYYPYDYDRKIDYLELW